MLETRITSLQQLKDWNSNPTPEPPIVAEWFYDWIFDECLKENDFEKFKDAYDTMLKFAVQCEDMSHSNAIVLLNDNLRFWYSRTSKDSKTFRKYFNKILIYYFGYTS